jgi:hypothetical protein
VRDFEFDPRELITGPFEKSNVILVIASFGPVWLESSAVVTLRYQLANRAVMLSPTVEESSRASFERGTDAS